MFTTLFSNELDLLSKEIEQKANYELQNSTVSETLNNEDNSIQYEIFEVFEVIIFFCSLNLFYFKILY